MTRSVRRGLVVTSAALLLSGCGSFPLPRVYVLGAPSQSAPGVTDETGLTHIELKTVTVPDYLDTTEIMRRAASNELVVSPTGQWGERVSAGITHALAIDLARRLPNSVIEIRGASESPRRLIVDVERFEIGEDGRCVLAARWRVTPSIDKGDQESRRGTFIEEAGSNTDAAAAVAMTSAIDQLARQIAVTVLASP